MHRELIRRLLHIVGLQADMVASGQEALDALEAHPYRVLLLDIAMPDMDGFETARRIRRRTGYDTPYIIAASALRWKNVVEECLAAGMDDFLLKPIARAELRDALAPFTAG